MAEAFFEDEGDQVVDRHMTVRGDDRITFIQVLLQVFLRHDVGGRGISIFPLHCLYEIAHREGRGKPFRVGSGPLPSSDRHSHKFKNGVCYHP